VSEEDFKVYLATFLSKPELDAITGFFYPDDGTELTRGLLRSFFQLSPDNFDELIASDTLRTVVADAKLAPDRRSTKKSISKIKHGFAHAQVFFQGVVDKYKTELGNVSAAQLSKALEEASSISNVPIKPRDIQITVDYFFPDGQATLAVNKLYHFLFERTTARQRVDHRVTSTALHNSVPIKIATKVTTQIIDDSLPTSPVLKK
jgi:hypothetical protein